MLFIFGLFHPFHCSMFVWVERVEQGGREKKRPTRAHQHGVNGTLTAIVNFNLSLPPERFGGYRCSICSMSVWVEQGEQGVYSSSLPWSLLFFSVLRSAFLNGPVSLLWGRLGCLPASRSSTLMI